MAGNSAGFLGGTDMKQRKIWLCWLYLYSLCAVLGFIPEPDGLVKAVMVLLSVVFFLPGFCLVRLGDRKTMKRVAILCAVWLAAACLLIMGNIASAVMRKVWGNIFYYSMVVVVSPMVCGQYWFVSLFLAACVLMYAISRLRRMD